MKQSCLLLALFIARTVYAQGVVPAQDAYLGEPRPGLLPRVFAPGKVSDGMANRDMAISPRGDEIFYTVQSADGQVSVVASMHYREGRWTGPEMACFSGKYEDLEPAFSASGDTLYFASDRPAPGKTGKNFDIWRIVRKDGHWQDPVRLDTTVNSDKDEFYPSVARNGNLYFTREVGGSVNDLILLSEWKNGYQPSQPLPIAINSSKNQFNAFVDPDEQFILFSSYRRPGEWGGGDLYLSVRNHHGEWAPAVLLDSTINSTALDFSPYVTIDKKYLFFTSSRMKRTAPFDEPLSFGALQELLANQGNGLNDIYWMEWGPVLKAVMKNNP
jgi:hypothetical protein